MVVGVLFLPLIRFSVVEATRPADPVLFVHAAVVVGVAVGRRVLGLVWIGTHEQEFGPYCS